MPDVKASEIHRDRPRGLPEMALTIGSSWVEDACPRRVWFRRMEGLKPIHQDRAPRFGTAWHATIQDVHELWRDRDGAPYEPTFLAVCWRCYQTPGRASDGTPCAGCGGTGDGPVARYATAWAGTEAEEDTETLSRVAFGWLARWGNVPPEGWAVWGVEVPLAFPIPSPDSKTGATFQPELPVVVRADGTQRLARTGEALPGRLPSGWRLDWARVPAMASVRLDTLWRGPRSTAWVGELKSSLDTGRYLAGLPQDPQVTIYELAVEHACATGALWLPGSGRKGWVGDAPTSAGWVYDVSSSRKQRDPTLLAKGGISTASNSLASVPPWRLVPFLAAQGVPWNTQAGKHEGRPVTWGERVGLATARTGKWYLRENGASDRELRRDVLLELYSVAHRRAEWHRAAARAENRAEVLRTFYRVPVCRGAGGYCPYKAPCTSDSPETRRWFTASEDRPEAVPVEAEVDWPDPDEG